MQIEIAHHLFIGSFIITLLFTLIQKSNSKQSRIIFRILSSVTLYTLFATLTVTSIQYFFRITHKPQKRYIQSTTIKKMLKLSTKISITPTKAVLNRKPIFVSS